MAEKWFAAVFYSDGFYYKTTRRDQIPELGGVKIKKVISGEILGDVLKEAEDLTEKLNATSKKRQKELDRISRSSRPSSAMRRRKKRISGKDRLAIFDYAGLVFK